MSQWSQWRKSSKSGTNGGQCVEFRADGVTVEMRDSKDPTGPVLAFPKETWRAFIDAAKGGEFDI